MTLSPNLTALALGGADLPDEHPAYAVAGASYPGFALWLAKVRAENRPCWLLQDGGRNVGLAILDRRGGGLTKLCTFCCVGTPPGTGSAFLRHVLDAEAREGAKEVYGEILKGNPGVMRFFARNGFVSSDAPGKPCSVRVSKSTATRPKGDGVSG